ncbi:hypothetical protein [Nocardia cyriacigeorgica]|uniref:hypothetical protein n=1 Tax=Nocardia cyriacigeorgica TaxID=135487 RepID=UPI0024549E0F|nr:hypothetical protein [Nocardia cyriacigeorgica]
MHTSISTTPQNLTEADPIPYVLVNGHGFGILLPDGSLYREPAARQADPFGHTPTVWMREEHAAAECTAITAMLETWYGIAPEVAALRVVRLEHDAAGVWRMPTPAPFAESYRPIDPDTGQPSAWPCASRDTLSVADAHQVMREHRECAGPITCRIRGRARAILARAGVMKLVSPARAANVWLSLRYPDVSTPWRGW